MIYVIGSINTDISFEVERIPKKGETIIADSCKTGLGGKGANQAVAIARLARQYDDGRRAVKLIGQVGKDSFGTELVSKLDGYGVDTEFVRQVNRGTGVSVLAATGKDDRMIVYSGANLGISKSDVDEALSSARSTDTLLCQLEVPTYIVGYALRKAHSLGMTTILNPAPAKELPPDFYPNIDIIIANEIETQTLTDINPKDWINRHEAMSEFHRRGVRYVVLTLGADGATFSDNGALVGQIPAREVRVTDTTAAGDALVGALALTYPHIGMYSFKEAALFATKAASITISRRGGVDSIPSFEEVSALYFNEIKI